MIERQIFEIPRIMNSFTCHIHLPLSGQWIDCRCRVWLVVYVKQRHQTNGDRGIRPQPVQAADVILAISKLKNTMSTGQDQIHLQHIGDLGGKEN